MPLWNDLYATYSIVAHDAQTGQFGVAVQTHQVAVGRRILLALPGYGALITQSLANLKFVPMAEPMLRLEMPPTDILRALIASDSDEHRRQVALVSRHGAAAHTGSGCIREAGHYVGNTYSVQANMMTRPTVIEAMRATFETATGDLAARLVAALRAAQAEDGDIRGAQSAALKVVSADKATHPLETIYDLRVDEHAYPVEELQRLVIIRRAQLIDEEGHMALERGDLTLALSLFEEARRLTPDQEELAFWQGFALAERGYAEAGAHILWQGIARDERAAHWLDLIMRLADCRLNAREGSPEALLAAVNRLRP
jgi:uncharacterized Ntn-hydrolase superfamily protein